MVDSMTDIEISRIYEAKEIKDIAHHLGILDEHLISYGRDKAKVSLNALKGKEEAGSLILVTAVNPTPYGEGKTTVSIGLLDSLCKLGKNAVASLREPSLGPVFGLKGGATGGGYAQVVPMDEINLHFTGDLHAITSANNLLAAAIDNHIMQGNELNFDVNRIEFRRCLDMNDRALRHVVVANGKNNGVPREEHFQITAASEVMSILCLSTSMDDLKKRLGNIFLGYSIDGKMLFARDLKVEGAMAVLLKTALNPNLVQTLFGSPVFIHGGPFANIAHGCSSVLATKMALTYGDYVVTEAGFGADLGAEKFFDIKCRSANLMPKCVVLVATIRGLKYHGGALKEEVEQENLIALERGLENLKIHVENLKKYHVPVIVTLNHFSSDTPKEIELLSHYCKEENFEFTMCDSFTLGEDGALDLAKKVVSLCDTSSNFVPLYDLSTGIVEKIISVATNIYRATGVEISPKAEEKIAILEENGYGNLPICIAKTQYSLSDDPKKLQIDENFTIKVRDVILYNGAGFVTVILGNIMTMPGFPKVPNYEQIDLDSDGLIEGIF